MRGNHSLRRVYQDLCVPTSFKSECDQLDYKLLIKFTFISFKLAQNSDFGETTFERGI